MTKTESTLLKNQQLETHGLLRHWCDEVAGKGGSFSINTTWDGHDWRTTYVINWPASANQEGA